MIVVFQSLSRVWLLWPRGLQHARLPCPSLSPRVCTNSCPLIWWCYLSNPLRPPFSFAFKLSQHHGLFQCGSTSYRLAKVLELQLQHQSFQWIFRIDFISVQFSRSVVFNSLRPHKPQHARPPYPSPTARVYSNPCPLSQWCLPTILSSVIPFSSCPQSFPVSGSFQISQLFASGVKILEFQLQH